MATEFRDHLEKLREIKAKTTWLQGVGAHGGKPAGEVVPGDVLVWNYGHTSLVTAILSSTKQTVTVQTLCDGKPYERKLHKARIVAIEGMGVYNVTQEELRYV